MTRSNENLTDIAPGLVGVLCDIDDTLTLHGRLPAAAYSALWDLKQAGLRVIPVTGRPAGWVDHIARMWPVDGVVGENGGLWFWHDGEKLQRRFLQDADERRANRVRLEAVRNAVLAQVPGAGIASDQAYRELDLAVDFCEDVAALDDAAIDAIVAIFEEAGATAKISSIHVNGWFGSFDKLGGVERLIRDRFDEELEPERWLYVGDSPNDEPMFAHFPFTVGVANVRPFLARMKAHPRWIMEQEGGLGFAACARQLLEGRSTP